MKTEPKTGIILISVFALTIIGSLIFTQYSIFVFNSLSISHSQVYTIPPYDELVILLVALFGITALFLYLIKHGLQRIIFWSFVVISWIVLLDFFQFIIPSILAIIVSILLILYYYKYAGRSGRNIINAVIFLTVASILSSALGFLPSMILVAIIAVYDYIAVYKTKHMVRLAKGIADYGFMAGFVFAAKKMTSRRGILLGGGDVVFPAVLINSTFVSYGAVAATFAFAGALAGLSLIIIFGRNDRAYPAMSFIGPLQICALGLFLLPSFVLSL